MAETFKLRTGASVSNSALETIYTAPASTSTVVIGCVLTNKSASNITADIQIVTASTTGENADDVYIAKGVLIPSSDSLEIIEGKVAMEAGDKFKVLSSAATALDVALSILEIS
jgi:hypothetical protein